MMQIDQIKELYDYNDWANERLWQAVADLGMDQLNIDMHNGIGSILQHSYIWSVQHGSGAHAGKATCPHVCSRWKTSLLCSQFVCAGKRRKAHTTLSHNTT